MKINVELEPNTNEYHQPVYPRIMQLKQAKDNINENEQVIVLFSALGHGICLAHPYNPSWVMTHSSDWITEGHWEDYDGTITITLQNDDCQ